MMNDYITALLETVFMVSVSTFFSVIFGFILALILTLTHKNGLKPNKTIYIILDLVINTLRSFPFIILMIAIIPLTRFIMGTSIGTVAAIVPLTIGATPFAARVIETALREVDNGLIETAQAFGCTTFQIIFNVIVKEALPSLTMSITLIIINLIGYSAMAGAIGAKGLGDLAIRYGYHGFKPNVIIITIIILIVLVQSIQLIGDLIYKKLIKKIG